MADSQAVTNKPAAAAASLAAAGEPTQGPARSCHSSPWQSMSDGSQGTGFALVQKYLETRGSSQVPSNPKLVGAGTEHDLALATALSVGGEDAVLELAIAESLIEQSEEMHRWTEQQKDCHLYTSPSPRVS